MALFSRLGRPVFGTLTPAHARAAAELHASAFAHGWSEVDFERLLAAENTLTDAVLENRAESLAGYILSRAAADEAEVLTIVIAQRWRGYGLGRELFTRHLARLEQRRIRALFLEVNADNAAARALYAKAGFVEVGRRKGYYAGAAGVGRADALTLRRAIR